MSQVTIVQTGTISISDFEADLKKARSINVFEFMNNQQEKERIEHERLQKERQEKEHIEHERIQKERQEKEWREHEHKRALEAKRLSEINSQYAQKYRLIIEKIKELNEEIAREDIAISECQEYNFLINDITSLFNCVLELDNINTDEKYGLFIEGIQKLLNQLGEKQSIQNEQISSILNDIHKNRINIDNAQLSTREITVLVKVKDISHDTIRKYIFGLHNHTKEMYDSFLKELDETIIQCNNNLQNSINMNNQLIMEYNALYYEWSQKKEAEFRRQAQTCRKVIKNNPMFDGEHEIISRLNELQTDMSNLSIQINNYILVVEREKTSAVRRFFDLNAELLKQLKLDYNNLVEIQAQLKDSLRVKQIYMNQHTRFITEIGKLIVN